MANQQKTYICTTDALRSAYCDESQLGRFIIDLPSTIPIDQTTFWYARIGFRSGDNPPSGGQTSNDTTSTGGLWDDPDGNPTPPPDENASPWRRADPDPLNPSPSGILWYQEAIQYNVRKTGYYCVGTPPFHFYRVRAHKTPRRSHCPSDRPISKFCGYKTGFDRRPIPPQIRWLRSV
jgi:hypothetical protein